MDRLIKLIEKIDSGFFKIKQEAEFLTAFYITTRYPGDYPEYGFKDAEEAFQKAKKIKDFVLSKIK